jgi:hypothetical protein
MLTSLLINTVASVMDRSKRNIRDFFETKLLNILNVLLKMDYKSLQVVTSPYDFSGSGAMDPKSTREKAKC